MLTEESHQIAVQAIQKFIKDNYTDNVTVDIQVNGWDCRVVFLININEKVYKVISSNYEINRWNEQSFLVSETHQMLKHLSRQILGVY